MAATAIVLMTIGIVAGTVRHWDAMGWWGRITWPASAVVASVYVVCDALGLSGVDVERRDYVIAVFHIGVLWAVLVVMPRVVGRNRSPNGHANV